MKRVITLGIGVLALVGGTITAGAADLARPVPAAPVFPDSHRELVGLLRRRRRGRPMDRNGLDHDLSPDHVGAGLPWEQRFLSGTVQRRQSLAVRYERLPGERLCRLQLADRQLGARRRRRFRLGRQPTDPQRDSWYAPC